MFRCPVCGFDQLALPPRDHEICPCCDTQFGYSDAGPEPIEERYGALRDIWITEGAHWRSPVIQQPFLWNPWRQLWSAGLKASIPYLSHMQVTETKILTETKVAFRENPAEYETA
jgi:hypothetical protein